MEHMKYIIRNARLLNVRRDEPSEGVDIIIENGKIQSVVTTGQDFNGESIEGRSLVVSPGWMDMRVTVPDPGYEYKENFTSFAQLAAAGGVTEAVLLPLTEPSLQTKDNVLSVINRNQEQLTRLYPLAAVTHDRQGMALTEMIDLHHAGAVGFTDGDRPLWHSGILLKALQYVQKFNGIVMTHAFDRYLSDHGLVNEGEHSTRRGLKGLPGMAESIAIQRNLEILHYTGGKLHFSTISTARGLELISKAKNEGFQVTCDVAAHNLIWDDSVINSFDTVNKVFPPYRTKGDVSALVQGVKDGVIDAIVSDHTPQDADEKKVEFDQAAWGIIGTQTMVSALLTHTSLTLDEIVPAITIGPRKVLSLPEVSITPDTPANLTVIDTAGEWTYDNANNYSKVSNSPLLGTTLKGKVKAVFNRNKAIIHS